MSDPETPAPNHEEGAAGASEAATVQPAPSREPSRKRQRPVKVLPTDRVSIQKQKDALKVYASLHEANKGPVTNAQVGSVIGLNASTAGLMNSFFVDTGLLEKVEGGFLPSEEVKDYLRAIQWEEEFPGRRLRPVLSTTWFSQALLPHLSVGSKDEKEAVLILAREANADRAYQPQLKILLDYLEFGGLIEQEGGTVRATPPGDAPPAHRRTQPEPELPPTTPAANQYTIKLVGGTMTVSVTLNAFEMSIEDRNFMFKIIDDLKAYEAKSRTSKESKQEEQ